ncbi:unnamed protein product [Sympodiomycopsis kandeliae]
MKLHTTILILFITVVFICSWAAETVAYTLRIRPGDLLKDNHGSTSPLPKPRPDSSPLDRSGPGSPNGSESSGKSGSAKARTQTKPRHRDLPNYHLPRSDAVWSVSPSARALISPSAIDKRSTLLRAPNVPPKGPFKQNAVQPARQKVSPYVQRRGALTSASPSKHNVVPQEADPKAGPLVHPRSVPTSLDKRGAGKTVIQSVGKLASGCCSGCCPSGRPNSSNSPAVSKGKERSNPSPPASHQSPHALGIKVGSPASSSPKSVAAHNATPSSDSSSGRVSMAFQWPTSTSTSGTPRESSKSSGTFSPPSAKTHSTTTSVSTASSDGILGFQIDYSHYPPWPSQSPAPSSPGSSTQRPLKVGSPGSDRQQHEASSSTPRTTTTAGEGKAPAVASSSSSASNSPSRLASSDAGPSGSKHRREHIIESCRPDAPVIVQADQILPLEGRDLNAETEHSREMLQQVTARGLFKSTLRAPPKFPKCCSTSGTNSPESSPGRGSSTPSMHHAIPNVFGAGGGSSSEHTGISSASGSHTGSSSERGGYSVSWGPSTRPSTRGSKNSDSFSPSYSGSPSQGSTSSHESIARVQLHPTHSDVSGHASSSGGSSPLVQRPLRLGDNVRGEGTSSGAKAIPTDKGKGPAAPSSSSSDSPPHRGFSLGAGPSGSKSLRRGLSANVEYLRDIVQQPRIRGLSNSALRTVANMTPCCSTGKTTSSGSSTAPASPSHRGVIQAASTPARGRNANRSNSTAPLAGPPVEHVSTKSWGPTSSSSGSPKRGSHSSGSFSAPSPTPSSSSVETSDQSMVHWRLHSPASSRPSLPSSAPSSPEQRQLRIGGNSTRSQPPAGFQATGKGKAPMVICSSTSASSTPGRAASSSNGPASSSKGPKGSKQDRRAFSEKLELTREVTEKPNARGLVQSAAASVGRISECCAPASPSSASSSSDASSSSGSSAQAISHIRFFDHSTSDSGSIKSSTRSSGSFTADTPTSSSDWSEIRRPIHRANSLPHGYKISVAEGAMSPPSQRPLRIGRSGGTSPSVASSSATVPATEKGKGKGKGKEPVSASSSSTDSSPDRGGASSRGGPSGSKHDPSSAPSVLRFSLLRTNSSPPTLASPGRNNPPLQRPLRIGGNSGGSSPPPAPVTAAGKGKGKAVAGTSGAGSGSKSSSSSSSPGRIHSPGVGPSGSQYPRRQSSEERGLKGAVKYTAHTIAGCCGLSSSAKPKKTSGGAYSGYYDVSSGRPSTSRPTPVRISESPRPSASHASSTSIKEEKLHGTPIKEEKPHGSPVRSPGRNPEKAQKPASPASDQSFSPGWTPPPGHFAPKGSPTSLAKVKSFTPGASTSGTKPVMYDCAQHSTQQLQHPHRRSVIDIVMESSYRRPNYADEDPYSNRTRASSRPSPPPTSFPRRDYDSTMKRSRSPDYSRRPTSTTYQADQARRSPSPYGYDRYRSRSPYSSRAAVDRDPYDRSERPRDYDRYDRDRDYDRAATSYDDDRAPGRDRYRGGGSAADRYAPDHDPYNYPDQDRGVARDRRRGGPAGAEADPGAIPDPLDSPALLQFKQFAQVHRQRQARLDPSAPTSNLSTQEMFNLYKRYKLVYTARSARKFWEEKQQVPFFVEKYGVGEEQVTRRVDRRRRGRQGKKKVWLTELMAGKLDGINFQMHFAPVSSGRGRGARDHKEDGDDSTLHTIFSRSGEPIKIASDSLPIEPCPNQLLIMRIPPTLARKDIEKELQDCTGFQYLAVGEAHANKHYFAIAWAVFDTPENTSDAKSKMLDNAIVLDNHLQLDVAARGAQVKFRTAPSGSGKIKRLAKDFKQARDLVRFLEKEDRTLLWPEEAVDFEVDDADREAINTDASSEIARRMFDNLELTPLAPQDGEEDEVLMQIADSAKVFASSDEEETLRRTIEKGLDFHLDILREVYNCDYYSSTICDFSEELDRRARAHFRRCYPNGETEAEREGRDTGEEGQNMGEEQWAENLDRKHSLLIGSPSVDLEEQGGVNLEKMCLELAIPYTRQDDKEKHRCIVEVPNPSVEVEGATKPCDKLFRALIFVQKHVCNKHKDLIEKELGTRKADVAYLNNYIRDPTRVMPPLAGSLGAERGGGRANGHHGSAPSYGGGDMYGGVMRMGASTFAADPYEGGGERRRGGGRRRSISPPLRNGGSSRLSERLGGVTNANPPPIHLGAALGLGGNSTMAGPPLHLRLGGSNSFGLPSPPVGRANQNRRNNNQHPDGPPESALSPSNNDSSMPLPPAPRPLDPRASRGQQRSYQDLDTGGDDGKGDVMELEY